MPMLKNRKNRSHISRCYHRRTQATQISSDAKEMRIGACRRHTPEANDKKAASGRSCCKFIGRRDLIYSDFKLSPSSGKVRMAVTVPLVTLAAATACDNSTLHSEWHMNGVSAAISHSLCNYGEAVILPNNRLLRNTHGKYPSARIVGDSANKHGVSADPRFDSSKYCSGVVGCRSKYSSKGFHPWKDSVERKESTVHISRPVGHHFNCHGCQENQKVEAGVSGVFMGNGRQSDNVEEHRKQRNSSLPQTILSSKGSNGAKMTQAASLVGLTIKNRHAVLVPESDVGILSAAIKNYEMRVRNQVHGSIAGSNKAQQRNAEVAKGREVSKRTNTAGAGQTSKERRPISLRESTTKKSALTRSSTDSRPTTAASKALQKTSSVSPAPSFAPPKLLNRFGFKTVVPPLKSGDSTDSVNSILSDAKTNSDLNLNRVGEENGNIFSADDKSDVLSSISQASSGVTSCIAGKLKAKTKQLPQLVKPTTIGTSAHDSTDVVRQNSAVVHYNSHSRSNFHQKSGAIRSSTNAVTKSSQNPVAVHASLGRGASFLPKSSEVRPNSEAVVRHEPPPQSELRLRTGDKATSTRCVITRDFGLKPSAEIDKVVKGATHETLDRNEVDVSEAWLRDKKNIRMKFDTKQPVSVIQKLQQAPKPREKIPEMNVLKEEKECLTYVRQKSAPYRRSQFGFSSMKTSQAVYKPSLKKSNSSVVQTRIAELEKTPKPGGISVKSGENKALPAPKKTTVRPTSLEKSPVLPVTTETIELSKPVYRKLQYTEGKKTYLSSVMPSLTNPDNGDILVVPSIDKMGELFSSNGECSEEKYIHDEKQTEKSVTDKAIVNANKHGANHTEFNKNLQSQNNTTSKKYISTQKYSKTESSSNQTCDPVTSNTDDDVDNPTVAQCEEVKSIAIPQKSGKTFKNSGTYSVDEIKKEVLNKRVILVDKNVQSSQQAENELNIKSKSESASIENEHRKNICVEVQKDETISSEELINLPPPTKRKNIPILESNDTTMKINVEPLSMLSCSSNTMTSSTESTTKSTSLGRISGKCTPTLNGNKGEVEQDFFIEDEISDQPGLVFDDAVDLSFLEEDLFGEDVSSPSHMAKPDGRSRAESAATLSSIGEDLILDYDTDDTRNNIRCVSKEGLDAVLCNETASVNTKQPISNGIPSSLSETTLPSRAVNDNSYHQIEVDSPDSDCIVLNRSTAQHIYQDVAVMKSLLLRLHKILNTEPANPLNGETKSSHYLNMGINNCKRHTDVFSNHLAEENTDLKKQVILLKQQMEEKNKIIYVLDQQLSQALHLNKPLSSSHVSSTVMTSSAMTSSSCSVSSQSSNAATQTDRLNYNLGDVSQSRTASVDDGLGPTVSSNEKIYERRQEKTRLLPEGHRPHNSIRKQNGQSEVLLTL